MGLFNKKQQINTESPIETWQLTVSGTVQGVGFRWSVLNLAKQMNICGTVCNNSDQTVTITLQTSLDRVNQFCTELPKKISQFARITKIHKEKLTNIAKMSSFHVLY
jgi:acylphosphatase